MSKIIYYLGAGASYGKRNKLEQPGITPDKQLLFVKEGLPVVSEIGFCLNEFKQAVASATIDISGFYVSLNRIKFSGEQVVSFQTQLLSDIEAV
jgi:hypothetical protein